MNENYPINPQSAITPEPTSKQSSFLTILLSVLLLISCLIAGFFAYQTQNLVKELAKLQSNPTPNTSISPSVDPTRDWKTYSNTKMLFSLKLPANYVANEIKDLGPNTKGVLFENKESEISSFTVSQYPSKTPQYIYDQNPTGTHIVDGYNAVYVELPKGYENDGPFLSVNIDKENSSYQINFYGVSSLQNLTIKQILSTFEFLDATATSQSSSAPITCTMDAKICPDGSSVGRSGPKCEFSPCPTTSPLP